MRREACGLFGRLSVVAFEIGVFDGGAFVSVAGFPRVRMYTKTAEGVVGVVL